LYQDDNGITNVSVRFAEEDLWITQKQLAEIYDTTKQNIGQHVKNIIEDGELDKNSVVKKNFTTAADGNSQEILVSSNRRQPTSDRKSRKRI
jgi:hypothetical protein